MKEIDTSGIRKLLNNKHHNCTVEEEIEIIEKSNNLQVVKRIVSFIGKNPDMFTKEQLIKYKEEIYNKVKKQNKQIDEQLIILTTIINK